MSRRLRAPHAGTQQVSRAVLVAALLVIALWVIRDFIPAIAWACVIAIAMWPMLKRFESHRLFRNRPTLIALVITAAISLLVVLPVAVAATQAIGARPARVAAHDPDNGIPVPDVVARLALRRGADHRMVAGQPRPSAACGHRDARRQQREIPRVRPAVRHKLAHRCSNSASCSSRCS